MSSPSKPRTISDRLSEIAKRSFVGRENEFNFLLNAVKSKELQYVVAFLHGPGGIGKSFLLQSFLKALGSESQYYVLDCRNMEPTPEGFYFSLGTALGIKDNKDEQAIIDYFSETGQRTVLALDTYETYGLMDTWLRQSFIPSLTENVFIIIAGRRPPSIGWLTTPGWHDLFREIELKELSDEDSNKMMLSRGIDSKHFDTIQRFARGYPLVLEMAATALRAHPDLQIASGPPPKVLQQLTQAFLSGLQPETVEAVEAASTVRRVTEPLLRALLDASSVSEVFDNLQALAFTDVTPEGLIFHDVVHDTISKDLSWRDSERYRIYRKRAWQFISRNSHHEATHGLWQHTADMLYLAENPVVREAFFPAGATDFIVEPATINNGDDIRAIAESVEVGESARLINLWWEKHPETFSVAKTREGKVDAFYSIFNPTDIEDSFLRDDPLTAAWLKHLNENPVSESERVLFLRRWLANNTGEAPSPAQGACWLDIKRAYMALRPSLRRLYTTVIDLQTYAPIVTPLGFVPIDEAHIEIGGTTFYSALLDFGPYGVDGWIASIVGSELGLEFGEYQKDLSQSTRLLATLLFTDIVDSTKMAANLGDRRWQDLLKRHQTLIRDELNKYEGQEIDAAGDSFLATFSIPARGIQCASAIIDSLEELDIKVRVGLHLGECEKVGKGICGIGVHIGARIAALAAPSEVLVSSTIKDAAVGSEIKFEESGAHALKGIPGEWSLFKIIRESVRF